MSERQREDFVEKNGYDLEKSIPEFVHDNFKKDMSLSTLAYDASLWNKGLLLQVSSHVVDAVLRSGDTQLMDSLNRLNSLRDYISKLENTISSSNDEIKHLRNSIESLDKFLLKRTVESAQQINDISWAEVRKSLGDNEVAVEFISYWSDTLMSYKFYALVLRNTSKYPQVVDFPLLGDGIISQPNFNQFEFHNDFWQAFVKPLINVLYPHEKVYFSPAGFLHQLSIENLPYDSISTLSDHFDMRRVSSTRELVHSSSFKKYSSAVVYGGISYDMDATDLLAESLAYESFPFHMTRGSETDSINRGSVRYLPGTKKEAEVINVLLNRHNVTSRLLTSKAANEESFKALSGSQFSIIHIGTHGFCWSEDVAKKKDFFVGNFATLNNATTHSVDPLNRSGLLFAGANIALSGHSSELPDGVQDGVLTAKEISLMDLRGCDLVVLSACETAKGDITSEGVFGLQRAFKMAGVQTIIMSLWPVNDNATQMLMTEFYTNWIERKQSKREAFKNAQNAVRYAVDKDGDRMYENPQYWAGFIMLD